MLMDSGAIGNLMPYLLYKKLGGTDEELIKTNMMVSGIDGGDPIGAKRVASMELTIGSKMIPIAFFVSKVQGNLTLIPGHDWIHANQCVHLPCINFLFSGSAMKLRWYMVIHFLSLQLSIQSLVVHMTTSSACQAWI